MVFNRNNSFAILAKMLVTYMMLSIKYWIQKHQFMVFGKVFKDMITSDAITSVRGIWTSMGKI